MSSSTTPAEVAGQIARALGETAPLPIGQIARIVRLCGAEQALAWLEEARAIETDGGMRTADGSRQRTLGGVYFKHVKEMLLKTERKQLIFKIFWQQQPGQVRQGAAKPGAPALPPGTWSERGPLIAEAGALPGKATTVKVTLIGRPGKIVERQGFTLLQMKHSGALPALPKGIPVPEKLPETTYVVYIGAKQWRGVAEQIKNPDDALIVEGTQIYDAEFKAIAVFATNTTTKLLQQAKRQQQ